MKSDSKKRYEAPALTVHGDVTAITKEGGFCANSDTPRGQAGKAYPPGSALECAT